MSGLNKSNCSIAPDPLTYKSYYSVHSTYSYILKDVSDSREKREVVESYKKLDLPPEMLDTEYSDASNEYDNESMFLRSAYNKWPFTIHVFCRPASLSSDRKNRVLSTNMINLIRLESIEKPYHLMVSGFLKKDPMDNKPLIDFLFVFEKVED